MSCMMEEPWAQVIEEPKPKDHRFRYKCEGNGAGSIPGERSTSAIRTTPTIKIHNMSPNEKAVIVVSCVNRSEPYHPHPHSLVGHSCNKGVCIIRAQGVDTIELGNVGIQCCRHQDVKEALKFREEIKVQPFQTGHDIDSQQIDLTAVRLCFQVFLPDSHGKFTRVVKPVVSREIIDRKTVSKLEICRLSRQSAFSCGGEEVFIFCDKAKKGDVQVRFFEVLPDGSEWEAFGGSPEVHKQYAVICITPRYHRQSLPGPVSVWVQLFRPSDNMTGEPKPFQFIPNAPDDQSMLSAKRMKIEQRGINITPTDYRLEERLLSCSQNPAALGDGLALMTVVGAAAAHPLVHTKHPPPCPSQANTFHEDNLTDLLDFFNTVSSGQPQVNITQTGQQCVNLTALTTKQVDLETTNQDGSIRVPVVYPEQTNLRSLMSSEVNIQFVNFAPTGQHHGNQRPYASGQAELRTAIHLDPFVNIHQRQMNVGIFTSNDEVNVDVTGQCVAPVNDVWTSQPDFNETNRQLTNCPSRTCDILDNNVGKLLNVDDAFPAGTVTDVTQTPVEDDIHQYNY